MRSIQTLKLNSPIYYIHASKQKYAIKMLLFFFLFFFVCVRVIHFHLIKQKKNLFDIVFQVWNFDSKVSAVILYDWTYNEIKLIHIFQFTKKLLWIIIYITDFVDFVVSVFWFSNWKWLLWFLFDLSMNL